MSNAQLDHSRHQPTTPLALRLLAHDLELAGNVGALFRIADALGVERLYLSGGTPRPPELRLRKAARSADAHVPWEGVDDPMPVVARLRAQGWRIVSLELTTASVDLKDLRVDPADRICLIVGAEAAGVAQPLLDASEAAIHIPMRGRNSSMNVASACAIAVYDLARRLDA